jgi:hypothetical protein
METLAVTCPACRQMLGVPEGLVGEMVKCPFCGRTFPAPDGPPPAQPAAGEQDLPPCHAHHEEAESDRGPAGGARPPRVLAVSAMTLAGGIMGILVAAALAVTVVGLVWPGTYYSLVMGILATVKGARLLGDRPWREPPPTATAVMQIINVINLDLVNLCLGILNLVLLNDPRVRRYFRG